MRNEMLVIFSGRRETRLVWTARDVDCGSFSEWYGLLQRRSVIDIGNGLNVFTQNVYLGRSSFGFRRLINKKLSS